MLRIPRLSQDLLADCCSSGFLLCSQPGFPEGTLFSPLKSPAFPASPDPGFSKTEGSVLPKSHNPGFPMTCSPASSRTDRTTIPRSPVLSKTDCVTFSVSDGEEEAAETQTVPDCPKSPVFPSSRPITDKGRSAVSRPPSSANERRDEEDCPTYPTHMSSEVNSRAPPPQCLSQSRTSLSLKRRRAPEASQSEKVDILDRHKISPVSFLSNYKSVFIHFLACFYRSLLYRVTLETLSRMHILFCLLKIKLKNPFCFVLIIDRKSVV